MKLKIFSSTSSGEMEKEINDFLKQPQIIMRDKSFSTEYSVNFIYKFICIWYDEVDDIEFKKLKN